MLERLHRYGEEQRRKREEMLAALKSGLVQEPVSATIFTIGFLKAVLVSTAITVGTGLLTRALTPRQKISTGQLQGAVTVPQSDQGLPIIEGYGADPASNAEAFKPSHAYALEDRVVFGSYFYVVTTAGTSAATPPTFPAAKGATVTSGGVTFTNYGRTGGGFRLGMLVPWTSGVQKRVTRSRGGGGGKGPKQPETEATEYFLSMAIMPGRGPLNVRRITANTDTIYRDAFGPGTSFYEAEAGVNTKAGGAANVSDVDASGGSAVSVPPGGSLRWNQVYSDGEPIILEFYYKSSTSISISFDWNGHTFNDTFNSTSGVYVMGYNSAPWELDSGSVNEIKVTNNSASTLTLDRLGVKVPGSGGLPTGVPNTAIPPDDDYTPNTIPSPNGFYGRALDRLAGLLLTDGTGTMAGNLSAGGHAGIAIYPGNEEQLPDPTIQADVDTTYGAGSTPAYHNRCLIVLSSFFLTKYGGAIPVINSICEHQEIDTLEALFEHWCERTGVLESDDYDFSDVRRVFLRGLPVSPPYSPADVMEELGRVFNLYFTEGDKIRARVRGTVDPVATLTSADIGWVEGDADESEEELPGLESDLATETEIARRYELTFIDPERGWEQNSQGTSRQVTRSEKVEKIDLAVTLLAEESRGVTQREVYEEAIESTKYPPFTLSWEYLWAEAGDTLEVAEDDGTTHRIFVTNIRPNVGPIPVEGFAEELAVYEQPVSTSGGGVFETPPVPIPAQTLWGVYDGPLLSDEHNTVNNGAGLYGWAFKRRGEGDFAGSALYVDRGLGYELLTTFDKQAIAGVCATALTATTTVHGIVADVVTVDLHDEDATLESYAEEDLWAGAGAAIFGDEVCQILEAEREPDTETYPNRWYVTVGLRARRGTDFAINDHAEGERFVLIDDAVKFIPLNVNERDVERDYRMVTSGQSLDDAATIPFVWTGGSVKLLAPVHVERRDDDADNQFWTWGVRKRMGHGLSSGWSGFEDRPVTKFEIDIWTDSTRTTLVDRSPVRVEVGMPLTAVFETSAGTKTEAVTATTTAGNLGRSLQIIHEPLNFIEGTLGIVGTDANMRAALGIVRPAGDWDDGGTLNPGVAEYEITLGYAGGYGLTVLNYGLAVFNFTAGVSSSERVRIQFRDNRIEFYQDWKGEGSVPFYTAPTAPMFPYHAYARTRGDSVNVASVQDAKMTVSPVPAFVYLETQQAEDGLTPGDDVHADIYPVDERGGRGYPAEVTLTDLS